MIFISVGGKLVRTTELRIDTFPTRNSIGNNSILSKERKISYNREMKRIRQELKQRNKHALTA